MIGKRLAALRKSASLTQKELAKQLNLTLYAISAYENNRNEPPDSIKILFAKRFNVSIDYLLGMTDNPNAYEDDSYFIRLPSSFPLSKKEELINYMNYIIYQTNESKNKKNQKY